METFGFYGNRLQLVKTNLYTPTEDALWLAAAVPANKNDHLFEAGFGTGAAGLSLLTRCPATHLDAIENHPELYRLGQQNIQNNQLATRVTLAQADIRTYKTSTLADHSFANPPFHNHADGFTTPDPAKDHAHGIDKAAFLAWLNGLMTATKADGTITLITHAHTRPWCLNMAEKSNRCLHILPLATHPNKPPKRLLAHLKKGAFTCVEHPPLAAYDADIRDKILRNAEPLGIFE